MTSFFFGWGWSDLDKISQTGVEWHVDCGDVVKIETRLRILIWRKFIPEPRITLQGAATWWIHCHDSTCHIAGCNNSIRHIENRFSPYFILFFVFNAVWVDERRLSYRLNTLVTYFNVQFHIYQSRDWRAVFGLRWARNIVNTRAWKVYVNKKYVLSNSGVCPVQLFHFWSRDVNPA